MHWFGQFSFWLLNLCNVVILVALLVLYLKKNSNFSKFLTIFFYAVIALVLLDTLGQILLLYFGVKATPFSQELMTGSTSYFWQQTRYISFYSLLRLAIGFLFFAIGYLTCKYQKKELVDGNLAKILLITTLATGFSSILLVIVGALLLAILWQIYLMICKKQKEIRLSINPFLLITALIIKILMIFPFYSQLLAMLHLI